MQGTAIRNLRLLKDLCGSENYGNIVLVTLGWSHPPNAEDENRETELRTTDRFWGEFIKQGATIRRHHGGKESAIKIVTHLLDKTPVVLKFQKELAKVGIIGKTSAGEEVILNLAKDKEADQKMIDMLQRELKTATEEKSNLQAQITNLQEDLDEMSKQIEKLNTSLAQRLKEDARLRGLGGDGQNGDRPLCSVQ
jgi:DNA repair exonuclease SbcCD ATPase subunit